MIDAKSKAIQMLLTDMNDMLLDKYPDDTSDDLLIDVMKIIHKHDLWDAALREAEDEIDKKWEDGYWQKLDGETVDIMIPDLNQIFYCLCEGKQ